MSLSERIIERVKAREAFAMKKYGVPLDPLTDKRNFIQEAMEEVLDALFYLEAQLAKGTRDKRYDSSEKGRARHKRYQGSAKYKAQNKRYNDSPRGRARLEKYRKRPEIKEQRNWLNRTYRKRQKIDSATL